MANRTHLDLTKDAVVCCYTHLLIGTRKYASETG